MFFIMFPTKIYKICVIKLTLALHIHLTTKSFTWKNTY